MSLLTPDSPCDNVCLEHQLALELKSRGLIERIVGVQMDESISLASAADCFVKSIDSKLARHLRRVGLGQARAKRTVVGTLQEIFDTSEPTASGSGVAGALKSIEACLQSLGCKPKFDVCVSYRGGVKDDQEQADLLCSQLHSEGIRAVAMAASINATGVLKFKPRIFVAVQSSASLAPLSRLDPTSAADPVAVEWVVALKMQASKQIDYLFPIFLGDLDADGERQDARLWGEGSEHVVPKVDEQVAALVPEAKLNVKYSKELLRILNQNQGQKVGGRPEATLGSAVRKIAQMGGAISQEQVQAGRRGEGGGEFVGCGRVRMRCCWVIVLPLFTPPKSQAVLRRMQELQADVGRRAHVEETLKEESALAKEESALAKKESALAKEESALAKEELKAALAEVRELKAALAKANA